MGNVFESPPMQIGKHVWRVIVTPEGRTAYEFKRPPIDAGGFIVMDDTWHDHRAWPGYDFNDTFYGLPKTLRKLWEANQGAIARILHGTQPAQGELLEAAQGLCLARGQDPPACGEKAVSSPHGLRVSVSGCGG